MLRPSASASSWSSSFAQALGLEDSGQAGEVRTADDAGQLVALEKAVLLEEPIKALGSYEVPIRLHSEVEVTLAVEVEREEG